MRTGRSAARDSQSGEMCQRFLLTMKLVHRNIARLPVQADCIQVSRVSQLSVHCTLDLLDNVVKVLSCLLLLLFLILHLAQPLHTIFRVCTILVTVPSRLGIVVPFVKVQLPGR